MFHVETTVSIPNKAPAVAFEPDCDDNVVSLVFGDDDARVRLLGSPDALLLLIGDLRDALADAIAHTAASPTQR